LTGIRIHDLVECPKCGKKFSVTYLPRHMLTKHKVRFHINYE